MLFNPPSLRFSRDTVKFKVAGSGGLFTDALKVLGVIAGMEISRKNYLANKICLSLKSEVLVLRSQGLLNQLLFD